MRRLCAILMACCLVCLRCLAIDPASVVILVNDDDHESIDLGYYYALKREVPVENIVHIPLPADEIITWDVFLDSLYNPLTSWLVEHRWLDGFTSQRKSPLGKQVTVVNGHKIGALVICRGVPLRIADDPERLPPKENYPEEQLMFYSNRASVDSELALISLPKSRMDGVVINPMFHRTKPNRLFDVRPVVVGRLDGPTYASARKMVDNALLAEEKGISGRVYIDLRGPHQGGDDWLSATA
ncbi:MAG: TIGR03790 family protein, partial [Verrucomicrobiae bacterium]|nr:TIGR03790 family protein [Verrucomicrobiae bacterium]